MSCFETNIADIAQSPVSSSQRRSDSRRVALLRRLVRFLGVVGMKPDDIVGDPLRVGGGAKDLALVLLEDLE
jgi:hypothetical protein